MTRGGSGLLLRAMAMVLALTTLMMMNEDDDNGDLDKMLEELSMLIFC